MVLDEFIEKFHINLTEQQLAAVKSISKPTLLLAVPGSGKTTVLVTRLGYMIHCCKIAPEKILTVTYTVAATVDMRKRFASVFGNELADRLEFRTINGICSKIIAYYGKMVGKAPFELLSDEGKRAEFLAEIYQRVVQEYPTESDIKTISTQITYIKNMQCNTAEIEKISDECDLPIGEIYSAYCKQMREKALMDYDDQMIYALTMLKKSPEILENFREQYQYICVDEAQDTSKIQHMIIEKLSEKYDNLFMVGDEDQSIYGFRAAYPEALLEFEHNHRDAQVLLMEENFRSNAKIVNGANSFIQKNKFRHPKTMKAHREATEDIQIIDVRNRNSQYKYLIRVAKEKQEGTVAVLYRDNESILPVVDLFERENISYRMKNADLSFFSHRIIADAEKIIGFAQDPYDTELFEQIYYKIGTYMNKATALEACRESARRKIPVLDAALLLGGVAKGTLKSVQEMKEHIEALQTDSAERGVSRIRNEMGYDKFLERMKLGDNKLDVLEAIAKSENTVFDLVERLHELAGLIREKEYDSACPFVFSTIHSSKGLEYDSVYLLDVQDGIFPEKVIKDYSNASLDEQKIYEEERRLFYVGVTRARERLYIFRFGNNATFTKELLFVKGNQSSLLKSSQKLTIHTARTEKEEIIVTREEVQRKLAEISKTGMVKHKLLGVGKVLAIEGDVLQIAFRTKTAKYNLQFMMESGMLLSYSEEFTDSISGE